MTTTTRTQFTLIDRTDHGEVTIITASRRVDLGHRDGFDVWTLISQADHDTVIRPNGEHLVLGPVIANNRLRRQVGEFLAWVVEVV